MIDLYLILAKKKSTALAKKDTPKGLDGKPITGIVPRTGSSSGLVKMDKDPTKGAVMIKDVKKINEFNPKVTYEFVRDVDTGEMIERPRIEFPDFKPIKNSREGIAVAQGYSKGQVIQFVNDFLKKRSESGDPFAERSPADYTPPRAEVAGNDGLQVWMELFKYGRQTVDRVCRHMGAFTHLYTQSLVTLLIQAGYLFQYEDETVDVIPDSVRDKLGFAPPRPPKPPEKSVEITQEDLPPKFKLVKIVELDEKPKKKSILKSKTSKEVKEEEEFDIPDAD